VVLGDDGQRSAVAGHPEGVHPGRSGTILAEARPRHRGRTTWIWDCDISDDAGVLCATGRITIAVRPLRPPEPPAA